MRDKYLIPIIVHRSSRLLPPPRKLWEGNEVMFSLPCVCSQEKGWVCLVPSPFWGWVYQREDGGVPEGGAGIPEGGGG